MSDEPSKTVPSDGVPPLWDEWLSEIRRRSDEFDADRSQAIPWEIVRTDALRRIGINASH